MLSEDVQYIVLSDLDGTLTEVSSSWQFIMENFGLWETKGRHHLDSFLKGDITYDQFIQLDVESWKGFPVDQYLKLIHQIPFRKGVKAVFKFFNATGAHIYLISSGLMDLALRAKKLFPVHEIYANIILHDSSYLNGRYIKNVGWNDDLSKASIVQSILKSKPKSIPIVALGDSSGDYPLIKCSNLSFSCFSTDNKLNQVANYRIDENFGFETIPSLVKKFLKDVKLLKI